LEVRNLKFSKLVPTGRIFFAIFTLKMVKGSNAPQRGASSGGPDTRLCPKKVNKLGLLAPWLGLAALGSFAALGVALVRRRRGV
jgi:hypothetical protein